MHNAENRVLLMSPVGDDLASVKDDMVAFIEGHGMRRFNGYVDPEEVQSVMWKADENPDAWKDFVELAKAAAAPFLTMDSWRLEGQELDEVIARLGTSDFSSDEDVEDARWLKTYLGKTGFVQLGFAQQGVMMVFEASTEWYERFQRLLEVADDFGGMSIDEPGLDDES
jgi:ABC-type taurine transport system substrate-binding protein